MVEANKAKQASDRNGIRAMVEKVTRPNKGCVYGVRAQRRFKESMVAIFAEQNLSYIEVR